MSYIDSIKERKFINEYGEDLDKKNNKTESKDKASLESDKDEINLSDEITNKLNEIGSELKSVDSSDNSDISSLMSKMQTLKSNISIYSSQLTYLDGQITSKQNELDSLLKQLEIEQDKYEEIEEDLKNEQNALDDKNDEIKKINNLVNKQKKIIENASSSTNEDEIKSASSELSSLYSDLSGLYDDKSDLESSILNLNTNLQNQADVVSSYKAKVSSLETSISSMSSQKSNITTQKSAAEEELNKIQINIVSEAEWKLVEENNINLTEKLSDGQPRYIFAKGESDNQYHIYDRNNSANTTFSSLARLYSPYQGYDIVSEGNGYISNFTRIGNSSGSEVFYMDECGEYSSFNACYCTSSPLSFDLNGDGVKTSNQKINYDIDGDGKFDIINDSADAVLVFDKDGDGISGKDGSECFGDNTDLNGDGTKDGFKNGFDALKEFALKNNLINGTNDNKLDTNDIKELEDNFGFKIKTNGYNSEAVSLSDIGITEINLSSSNDTTLIDNFDGNGNQLMKQNGATFKINGETKEYADIWHKKHSSDIEESANLFAGDSLNFSIGASLNYKPIININKTSSLSEKNEALKEIRELEKEASEILKDKKKENK